MKGSTFPSHHPVHIYQSPDIAALIDSLEIVWEKMFLEIKPFGNRTGLYLNITTKTKRRLPAPLLNGIVLSH